MTGSTRRRLATATALAAMSRDAMAATKRLFHRVADLALEAGAAGRPRHQHDDAWFRTKAHK